ncbi:MAG: CHAT domain-containing tetratricopeptide repeat protein [Chitinophagaceae bacterium]
MYKFGIAILCTILVFLSFSQTSVEKETDSFYTAYIAADNNFTKAIFLSDNAGDDEVKIAAFEKVYKQSLLEFTVLLPGLKKNNLDSLYFMASVKTGLIHDYFDSSQLAKIAYTNAIKIKERLPQIADSFLFQPLLFAGSIYYRTGEFDSALLYLKKAEAIKTNYTQKLQEEQRLYNLLGVLSYETGNLDQSLNYVEKAIENMSVTNSNEKALLINYQLNIASILSKLERYAEAEAALQQTNQDEIYKDEINHKLGYICLKTARPGEAIRYFDKVKYPNTKKIIDLLLNKSKAYQNLNEPDSATYYLLKAKTENLKWNGSKKNISNGIIFKQEAEQLVIKKEYRNALALYQQSILQFSNTFSNTSTDANPETFSGTFAFIDLFNVLTAKGDVLKQLHDETKDIKQLEDALNAYRSGFKLAAYVEKTYNSDEARLFLGKIKHTVHSKPIDISLQLYDLTHKKEFLEEAYLFDQRNKASVLSFNIQVKEIKTLHKETNELIQKEALLKSGITRLSIKTATITDTGELQKNYASIRNTEIELEQIQEKIQQDPAWQQKSSIDQIPPVATLQKKLDPATTLLSYHLSENELLILLISSNQFEYFKSPVDSAFFTNIELLKKSLASTAADSRYAGTAAATSLYEKLMLPLQARMLQKKRLIIIPDDELNYLPFEVLQDANKKYLLEKFAIQYQFSTALISKQNHSPSRYGILAFAPFASHEYEGPDGERFSMLPGSKEETGQFKGTVLSDSIATKFAFLQQANRYNIVHLATHASVNNTEPMRSFISFYPGSPDYKLYAREIYDLDLDSLQLIILSACETGSGQLVKGEGLMSLSRAFTYAGCPNIITSLWKAEDKTTAFITGRLHYYLSKKYTKDHALQQAKLDLLQSNEIDPRLKSPNYWAHLIFIGNYEPGRHTNNWWWMAIVLIAGAFVYSVISRKKPRSKNRA